MATHDSVGLLPRVLTPIKEQDASDASVTSTEDVQHMAEAGKIALPTATDDTENGVTESGITDDVISGDGVTENAITEGGATEGGATEGGATEGGATEGGVTEDGMAGDVSTEDGTIDAIIKDTIIEDGVTDYGGQEADKEIRDVTHDVVVSFHVDSDATFQVTTADVVTKFKVSACSVATASPVWRNMLYGQAAGRPASGDWVVEVEGDLKALDTLFRIIHYQFSKVPTALGLDELFELMLLTDRFKCTHLVFPWARKWASNFAAYACEKEHFLHCHKVAFIAWELGTEKLFCDMVYAMIISSKVDAGGDLVNVSAIPLKDMILPTGMLDIISATRTSTLEKILTAVKAPLDALTHGKRDSDVKYCKVGKDVQECEAMLLGSAIPALVQSGLFPVPSATNFSGSINQLVYMLQSIKCITYTSATWKQIQGHQHCNLGFRQSAHRYVEETTVSLGHDHIAHLQFQAGLSGVDADFEVPENQTQKFQVGNFVYKDTWIDPRERAASQQAMNAQAWNGAKGKGVANSPDTGHGW